LNITKLINQFLLKTNYRCKIVGYFTGHWSGTNSNRHSLDSDNVKSDIMPKFTSDISLGPDSGRGSPILQDDRYRSLIIN
jgi:hypothetical protein